MIKKILLSLLVLVVVVAGGIMFYLDTLVANGVESVGSRTLATRVDVDRVILLPFAGRGSIGGLNVANPEGFESPYAFELEEISVALDLGSLISDLVEVDSIIIESPLITYEGTLRGDNLRTLLGNIPPGSGDSGASGEPGKELLIREFRMLNPRVNLITSLASEQVTIPDIVLTDIGTAGSGGATPRQVARTILERVSRAVLEGNLPQLDEIEDRARETLDEVEGRAREAFDGAREDLGNQFRGLLGGQPEETPQDGDSTPQ